MPSDTMISQHVLCGGGSYGANEVCRNSRKVAGWLDGRTDECLYAWMKYVDELVCLFRDHVTIVTKQFLMVKNIRK